MGSSGWIRDAVNLTQNIMKSRPTSKEVGKRQLTLKSHDLPIFKRHVPTSKSVVNKFWLHKKENTEYSKIE